MGFHCSVLGSGSLVPYVAQSEHFTAEVDVSFCRAEGAKRTAKLLPAPILDDIRNHFNHV